MELVGLSALVIVAFCMVIYAVWPKDRNESDTVRRRALGLKGGALKTEVDVRTKARTAARSSLLSKAAPMLSRPMMPKDEEHQSTLRRKLANAGYRKESTPPVFLASKTVGGIVLGGLALFFAISSGKPFMTMFGYAAVAGGIGFLIPELWLYSVRKQRMQLIRQGLPDALDLMVVSVEAGLGLDASMQRVGDEMAIAHPELCEELQITTVETQMGIGRAVALERMSERVGIDEMKSLVAVITQAEKLGTSVAKALRAQADSLRTKRRQRAEEKAQKTAVKLMLPLILFIFPAIMIVLGAPAGIKIYETMSKGGWGGS
ncbi:MAG: type II secretion system F family protein [Phycisphaerae bacterium]